MSWISKAFRVGRIAEPAAPAPQPIMKPPAGVRGSLQLRHVDAGSCNGCEVEISGAFGPVYEGSLYALACGDAAELMSAARRILTELLAGQNELLAELRTEQPD